ncbi:zinc finger protein 699-like [Aricia agestis]|uniref:zinc finger protein 699-like n=1 Tax=Aricia agestis TaxID=91739 RepID=UPI001C2092BB|nr:zinc finger protein 699-like [Aricia agestis]
MLACRICLATDIRLYDINTTFNLKTAYETITGSQISKKDGLPQHICSYCSIMLVKCSSFQDKCCYTQGVLKYLIGDQEEITQFHITSIQQSNPIKGFVRLSRSDTLPLIEIEYKEPIENVAVPVPIKEEYDLDLDSLVKIEECLAEKKVEKTIPKVKKTRKKKKKSEDFKIEPDSSSIEIDNPGNADADYESDRDQDNHIEMEEESVEDLKKAKVIILSADEQFQELEARKTSANYTKSKYQCHRCFRGFISETTFNNHLMKHDPKSGDHECAVCGVRWAEPRLLRAHIIAAHARKFQCTLCDHVSRSAYRAKEHYKWHNGFKFKCKLCDATFGKSTSALTHMRLAHPSRHSCEVCGESFVGDLGLRMHKRRTHKFLTDNTFQCVHCQVRFQCQEALTKHQETTTNGVCDANIPCLQCGQGFTSEELLQTHLKEHQSFSCDECSCTFTSELSYGVHVERVHLGVRKRSTSAARRPLDTAVCEVCGKKCVNMATLRYHQRTHTGEKPFACSDCPKRFSVYQRLQIHIRTHTGESPYKCPYCPKAFKHKAALNRHDRVHSGARPYGCPHCGKTFTQSNSRKMHINTVHLKLPAPYRNRKTT